MRGKATMQTERDEHRFTNCVPVWEPSFVVAHVRDSVFMWGDFSENCAASRLKGGCGQNWPPHRWCPGWCLRLSILGPADPSCSRGG